MFGLQQPAVSSLVFLFLRRRLLSEPHRTPQRPRGFSALTLLRSHRSRSTTKPYFNSWNCIGKLMKLWLRRGAPYDISSILQPTKLPIQAAILSFHKPPLRFHKLKHNSLEETTSETQSQHST